jgi:ribosomal protein S18 acetylase RimI-like enzyme
MGKGDGIGGVLKGANRQGELATRVVVRDAQEEDNQPLIALDRQCVMGEQVQLVSDRSPDFFARSKVYETFRLAVAEEEGRVIGVGGVTFKTLRVGGKEDRWAYLYDLRVAPSHRRQGVANRIADHLRKAIQEAGITRAYSWVMEHNTPSESFVERRGSVPLRRCCLALLSHPGETVPERFEQVSHRIEEMVSLLEETYRRHHFLPLWDPWTLRAAFHRLKSLGWRQMYGKKEGGRWVACFGLWDYSRVMRMSLRDRAMEVNIRPFFLYPLGWRDPDALREGILAAQSMVAREGGTLLFPYDPQEAIGPFVPRQTLQMGMTLYVRNFSEEGVDRGEPIFVDPRDL